jgi:hypothetical protein
MKSAWSLSPCCADVDVVRRLNKLLGDVVISQGGVVPFIQPELLPNATK